MTSNAPATRSKIPTQVGGVLEWPEEAAAFPSTNAATTPMMSVRPNAPMKNHSPVRPGRSASTSASTQNVSVVGDNIAATAVSPSSTSTEVTYDLSLPGPPQDRSDGGASATSRSPSSAPDRHPVDVGLRSRRPLRIRG